MTTTTGRARAMPPGERREAILTAVMPLLLDRGRAITTREIAGAAGVAEGTIFRAFGDKDSLIDAAIARMLDPEEFRDSLRAIEPDWPLERKLAVVIGSLQVRMTGTMGILAAVGYEGQPPEPRSANRLGEFLERILAPELQRLRVPNTDVAFYVRLVAFASSVEQFNRERPFTVDELTRFVLYGIAGKDH